MSNDYLQYVMSETWSYQKHEVLWLFDESNHFLEMNTLLVTVLEMNFSFQ